MVVESEVACTKFKTGAGLVRGLGRGTSGIARCHSCPDAFGVLTFKGDVPRCLRQAFAELVDHADAAIPGLLGGQIPKHVWNYQPSK
jgi:hypothetical protein